MKRIVCILLISALLPVLNVGATEYDVAWLWADHKKFVDGEIRYRMIPDIMLDSGSVNAFLDLPDKGLTYDLPYVWEMPLNPSWYEHFSVFYGPAPGDWWKTSYQFRTDDGLTTPLFSHVSTNFIRMGFVQAQITGQENPTITWDPVAGADEYRVRLYNPDNDTLLFNETIADDGSPSYSYTYTGDLFVQYDYLWVVLEARHYEGEQLLNRSKIYYEHSVTPVGEYLITLKLKNVPESLTFYQDYVGDNILEHGWAVEIDTDDNASTGDSNGYDIQISINNYKIPGMAPTIMPIMDATRKHTWIYTDPSPTLGPGTKGHPIRAEIDSNTDTIKMIVREDFAELADLDITDRFRFTAYYQSPTGFISDNTSENLPGSNMVSDPEGDVGYDFIDILEGKIEYRSPVPTPDIKANGQDDPIIVTSTDSVDLSISLDPGTMNGQLCEWWGILLSSYGTVPLFGFKAPLFDLAETTLFDTPLPPGWYIFLFNVEDTPDGSFQYGWYDYVVVVVQPTGSTHGKELPDVDALVREKIKQYTGN
jgi:hypothetical protein